MALTPSTEVTMPPNAGAPAPAPVSGGTSTGALPSLPAPKAPAAAAPAAPGVLTPETTAQLMAQAQAQAAGEVSAAEAPYNAQISLYTSQAEQAQGDISSEFASLLPQVTASATQLGQAQDSAVAAEQQVFTAAGQQLNTVAQNQAKEAQDLAQQMGGPVSTSEFTQGITPFMSAFPSEEAGGLLHALGLGQAGKEEAQTFAGQVFPAMQTEEEAQSRNFFNDKITAAQDQIAQLASQKAGLVNDKYTTLLGNERTFELNLAQAAQAKIDANRQWKIAQHTLANDDARLALATQDQRLRTAATTGTYKGKPTLAATKFDVQTQQRATALGIQAARLQIIQQHYTETDKIAQQRANIQERTNAMSLLDASMGASKGITLTTKQWLSNNDPQLRAAVTDIQHPPKDVHYDPKTKRFYQYVKKTLTPQQWAAQGGVDTTRSAAITDPNQLYAILTGAKVSPAMAQALIRQRTGLGDWAPGKNVNYTSNQLGGMGLDELKGIALQRGYKQVSGMKSKQAIIDLIQSSNPQNGSGVSPPSVP